MRNVRVSQNLCTDNQCERCTHVAGMEYTETYVIMVTVFIPSFAFAEAMRHQPQPICWLHQPCDLFLSLQMTYSVVTVYISVRSVAYIINVMRQTGTSGQAHGVCRSLALDFAWHVQDVRNAWWRLRVSLHAVGPATCVSLTMAGGALLLFYCLLLFRTSRTASKIRTKVLPLSGRIWNSQDVCLPTKSMK